jgi:hypothetical protein
LTVRAVVILTILIFLIPDVNIRFQGTQKLRQSAAITPEIPLGVDLLDVVRSVTVDTTSMTKPGQDV